MIEVLKQFENAKITDLTAEELRQYQTALQERAGTYVRAYRICNDRLRKVGQELERRKTTVT